MIRRLKYFDWPLLLAVIISPLLGLLMIYSTGGGSLWVRQLLAFAIGLLGLFFLSSVDYHFFRKNSTILFLAALLLLLGVLFFGQEIRGSRRWFDLGFFNFQPAEVSKLALIVLLAKYFQIRGQLLQKFRYVLWSGAFVLLPVSLLILQPDLGSAGIHLALWLGMLFLSPMPRRYFFYLLVIFLLLAALSWQFILVDYQKARLLSFLDPTQDPLGRGYNVIQAIVAVGSGGPLGRGFARGAQSQLKFLPEQQTDFIFASTVEELGLLGGGLVLGLLSFLLFRMIKIMKGTRDLFGTYLAAGIFFLILSQSVVNLGMNLGLLPVTGITLPFLSYGGSSLMVTLWLMGIMQNLGRAAVPVRFG